MADFLFELGIEEVPVYEVQSIIEQLKDKFESKLAENMVKFKTLETAASNRKFMIYISNISEKVNSKEESILGPSKKIAFKKNGQPSIALQKFLEFNDAQLSDIIEIETKKGIYISINRTIEGKETAEILQSIIPEILGELTFSKTMVWNKSRVPFIRPITNILPLFNNTLIEFEFGGIRSSDLSKGHTLLSESTMKVNSFKDYIEQLNKNFVILKEDERKNKIINEIEEIEDDLNAQVRLDNEMLHYYIYSNEYPVVFTGEFDKKYLRLPSEVISTFMTKEKKLLPVYKNDNILINIFVGVSNIPDEKKFVVKGNEKVIQAAFEDANFFWAKDKKDDFISLRENLKKIVFHKNLGNFFEKTERLSSIIDFFTKEINKDDLSENLKKAAYYCKNDLVTRMVREFPSLQGVMGGLYLKEIGAEEDLWKSVYLHYEPKGFSKQKLEHLGSAILSIVDKMDNIIGFISKGIKISSSKDPYGIRRDANAIIKCIIDFKLDFDLNFLIKQTAKNFSDNRKITNEITKKAKELFLSRIENIFKEFLNFRYDVVNSTLNQKPLYIYKMYLRTQDVAKMVKTDSIRFIVSIHKRLKNIIKNSRSFNISEDLFRENEEKILFEIFKESKAIIEELILTNNYLQACSKILEMKPIIDNFFDKILVMAKDKKIKENRIGLLQKINELLSKIADFSLIV